MTGIKHQNTESTGGTLTAAEWNADHYVNAKTFQGTTDISTDSASYADTTDELTIVTTGGEILITGHFPYRTTTSNGGLLIMVDSGTICNFGLWDEPSSASAYPRNCAFAVLGTNISAGTHTVKLRWNVEGGTLDSVAASDGRFTRVLNAIEIDSEAY